MKVLIVGGGIGGLSAAIALGRASHEVTLVERAAEFSPVGAGIVMAPNAAQILAWLGVELGSVGHPLGALDIVRADGALLQRIDTARSATRNGPTFALARPELHEALLAAVPPGVRLLRGATLAELDERPEGVRATLAGGEVLDVDLVVGADGLRSNVRERVMGAVPTRYSGVTCYRGITEDPGFDHAIEAWGGAARVGVVPLSRGRLYYYLVHTAPQRAPALPFPGGFGDVFGGIRGGVERLFSTLTEAPPLHHDLEELDAPTWGRGRVLLLGDAAHAMTPNQGQGAAMAIEDAVALVAALRPGAEGALDRYVALRHDRVRKVQLDSRRIGDVSHLSGPIAQRARDGVMRMLPASLSEAQYRAVIEPGLRLLASVQRGA